MPATSIEGTRISIFANSKEERDKISRHIRANLIRFGPDLADEHNGQREEIIEIVGNGMPYLKAGKPWDYPFLKIISSFPETRIEVSYQSIDGVQKIEFGRQVEPTTGKIIKLRPSDLSFLRKCPRCFFLRYNYGLNQAYFSVSGGIASALAEKEEQALLGEPTLKWCPSIKPDGQFSMQGETVASAPISANRKHTYYIGGKFDLLAELEDDSFAVVDCKTTAKDDWQLRSSYFPQLMAYRYCIQNPPDESFCEDLRNSDGRIHRLPTIGYQKRIVNHLGLMCFNLNDGSIKADPHITTFNAEVRYVPIAIDDDQFMDLIQDCVEVLEQDAVPSSWEMCSTCNWYADYNAKAPVQN